MEIHDVLHDIQQKLKAPKNQTNSFGGYRYRSCEDILEAVKPLLPKGHYVCLSDEIMEVGGRLYVKASVYLYGPGSHVGTTAYAREADTKKGMDVSQITGAASSYARKYALNGLFCIDDTKDADSLNNGKDKNTLQPEDLDFHAMCSKAGISNVDDFKHYCCELTSEHRQKTGNGDPNVEFDEISDRVIKNFSKLSKDYLKHCKEAKSGLAK